MGDGRDCGDPLRAEQRRRKGPHQSLVYLPLRLKSHFSLGRMNVHVAVVRRQLQKDHGHGMAVPGTERLVGAIQGLLKKPARHRPAVDEEEFELVDPDPPSRFRRAPKSAEHADAHALRRRRNRLEVDIEVRVHRDHV